MPPFGQFSNLVDEGPSLSVHVSQVDCRGEWRQHNRVAIFLCASRLVLLKIPSLHSYVFKHCFLSDLFSLQSWWFSSHQNVTDADHQKGMEVTQTSENVLNSGLGFLA